MTNILRKIEKIEEIVTPQEIEALSIKTKFQIRKPRKFDAWTLINGFLLMRFTCRTITYASWADRVSLLIQEEVSDVAIFKRLHGARKNDEKLTGERLIEFLQYLICLLMERCQRKDKKKIVLPGVNKILIQDSTCLKLKGKFKYKYPGIENQFKETDKAELKIDTIYDATNEKYHRFSLSGFTENDYSHSKDIFEYACPKDLVVRDLGYSSIEVFKMLSEKNVYFLSRLKYQIYIFDPDTSEVLDIGNLMKNKELVDMQVTIGKTSRFPVRLLIFRAPENVEEDRINKAINKKNRRVKYGKEYKEFLKYTVLITNMPKSVLKDQQVALTLYKIRWRIESIFKSWKSYFNVKDIKDCQNLIQLECYIYMMFVHFILFNEKYLLLSEMNPEKENTPLSLLRLSKFIQENYWLFFKEKIKNISIVDRIFSSCCYDKQKDRTHFPDLILSLG